METLPPIEWEVAFHIQEQGQELDHPHRRRHHSVAVIQKVTDFTISIGTLLK